MKRIITTLFIIIICMTISATESSQITPQDNLKIIDNLAKSVVIVEYYLQYDKGDAPISAYVYYLCPSCGSMHSRNSGRRSIVEKRAIEVPGFVISNNIVIAKDIGVQNRFIKSIKVKTETASSEAKIVSYAIDENAIFLKLDKPLKGTKPLVFDKEQEKPFCNLSYKLRKAKWCLSYYPFGGAFVTDPFSSNRILSEEQVLVTTTNGVPVGISMNGIIPLDDSWKGSPMQWKQISSEEMHIKLKELEKYVSEVMPRVYLKFRSPESDANGGRYSYSRNNSSEVEMNCLGMAVTTNELWIIESIDPKTTARLEEITVYDSNSNAIPAKFKYNMKEYGVFVVEMEKPLKQAIKISNSDLRKDFNKLLLRTSLKVAGENKINYFWHCRISDADFGYLKTLYPEISGAEEGCFIFDMNYNLLAFPLIIKEQTGASTRRWSSDKEQVVDADFLSFLIKNSEDNIDPNNKPMSKEDAARVAWLGFELQGLDMNLARANNAIKETKGGKIGGLINYVYTNSPAQKAGIKSGMILLRLFVKGNPTPINIELDSYGYDSYNRNDIRENMGRVPVEYLNQMPPPWQSIENTFTALLTKIGFGKAYTAEFFDNGKIVKKDFIVEKSPVHYKAAKKYKDQELGITCKDLTFEVLRYMKKPDDAAGLIISKVEPGSRADVAGIKTYEIITSINGQAVNNIDEFKEILKNNDELIMTVERMNKPRQVRIVQSEKVPEKEQPVSPGLPVQ